MLIQDYLTTLCSNRGLRFIYTDFLKEFLTRITLTRERLAELLPNANYIT